MPTRRKVVQGAVALASLAQAQAQSRNRTEGRSESQSFVQITTLRSARAGEHWVSPFGIPVPWEHDVSAARADRLVARYPNVASGTLYPIQSEQHRMRRDGNLQFTVGHLKLPVGYAANSKVGIGYSDTFVQPAAPSWTAISDDIVVELDVFEPRVHYVAMPNADQRSWTDFNRPEAYDGDVLTLTISDNQGPDLVYTHEFRLGLIPLGGSHNVWPYRDWCDVIMRKITQDPAGRYLCYERNSVRTREWNRLRSEHTEEYLPRYSTSSIPRRMGRTRFGLIGRAPRINNSDAREWPSSGFLIWPRNRPGSNHDNYRVSFSIQRNATALPIVSAGTIANAWRRLNFKSKTQAFNHGDNQFNVVGATSGAIANVKKTIDNGATGALLVDHVLGEFVNGERLAAINNDDQKVNGSAVVDGPLRFQTLTSSSGGSAKLRGISALSGGGLRVFVTDVTGTFRNGDTLTASDGGTTTQNGAAHASTFSLYTDHDTTAQRGTIAPINDAVTRTRYVATWRAATPTRDSPWFSGHQILQEERRMAPAARSGAPHPHLEVWMQVTKDAAGNIVHRRVNVENAKYASASRDYWYDATIKVGGANQTDARHQHLFHAVREAWSWRQNYPTAMCDPADFMKSRCIIPLVRYPDWDNTQHLLGKFRGKQGSISGNFTSRSTFAHYDYERARLNDPLWPIPYDYSGNGGARGEMGEMNAWESSLWQGDLMRTWPLMEAMGDNGAAAQGILHRDEQSTDPEDSYLNRHIYLKWDHTPLGPNNTYSRPIPARYTVASSDQKYDLTGSGAAGSLTQSHSPSIGSTSLYLLRPEKWFFDLARAYSWHFFMMGFNNFGSYRRPKKGSTAGAPDHIMGYQIVNGNRTFARPAREVWKASFISNFAGCRQRAMWRRVAQDLADHANRMAERTIWGVPNVRKTVDGSVEYNSDSLLPTRYLPGDFMVHWGSGSGSSQTNTFPDLFKAGYIMLSALYAHGNNAADFTMFWRRQSSFTRLADRLKKDRPGREWWWAFPGNVSGENPYLLGVSYWNPTSVDWYGRVGMYAASAINSPIVPDSRVPVWPTDDFDGIVDLIRNADTPQKKNELGIGGSYPNQQVFTREAWAGYAMPGEPGYSMPKEYHFCILGIAEYGNPTDKAIAQTLLDDFDATLDPDTVARHNEGYAGTTVGQIWSSLAAQRYSAVRSW